MAQRTPRYQYVGYTTDEALHEAFRDYRNDSEKHDSNSSIVIEALEEKLAREGYYDD